MWERRAGDRMGKEEGQRNGEGMSHNGLEICHS